MTIQSLNLTFFDSRNVEISSELDFKKNKLCCLAKTDFVEGYCFISFEKYMFEVSESPKKSVYSDFAALQGLC